jgi:antitoxin VapB
MYILQSIYEDKPLAKAKIFVSGNSQAVRLPKEFRLRGSEVEIFRRGDEIVLREQPRTMGRAFDLLTELETFERNDVPPQDREDL